MPNEPARFAVEIGAKPLNLKGATEDERKRFKSGSYFELPSANLIIKISRKGQEFWGVGKAQIDILAKYGRYYVILLASEDTGWSFSDTEAARHIKSGHWPLRGYSEYKVHRQQLPEEKQFISAAEARDYLL